jgi:two-component system phosphate regulon sensor histidine kinase PhoR
MGRSVRYRSGLAWALGIGLVMAAFSARGALSGLEWRAYDLQLAARASGAPHRDIVIVLIDDQCLDPDRLGPWPWPMSRHAELVRRLAAAHPRAIIFDLLFFGEPGAGSVQFAQALRDAGNVYLAVCFLGGARPLQLGRYGVRMSELRAPPRRVIDAAAGVGAVNVFPERDGVVRSAPLLLEHAGGPFPSLALRVAGDILGASDYEVTPERPRDLLLGELTIPLSSSREMLINYAGGYRVFPVVGYDDVLAGKIPPKRFRDRIVFVGFSATGLSDTRPTPLAPACPGVEITAHALHTILRGDFIRPLGGLGNALLVVVITAVLGVVLPRLRPLRALLAGMGAALLVVAGGTYLFQVHGLWLNTVTPALAAVAVGLAVAADGYHSSDREKIRLEYSLGALALATRMIAASTSRRPVLAAIREEITQLVAARQTDIYLVDEDAQELALAASDPEVRVPLSEGALGRVAREGLPVLSDAGADPELAHEAARAVDFTVGPVALVPLRRHNQVAGVAQVVREAGRKPFSERDLEVLNALSQEAAVALENVELYEKLEGKVELANREMVRAYSQLALEKDRVEALLETMADGVIMTDLEQRVLYINPAGERMFRVGSRDVQGEPLARHFNIGGLADVITEARSKPADIAAAQLVIEEPRRLVLTANAALIADDQGQPVGVVTVLSDVTLLQELSDMKTEFVSLVSHELRTPLTSIQGFAQTLQSDVEGHFDADARREFLEIIGTECHRLLTMINELLDASRIEAGRPLPMNWGQVDLRETVGRVVKLHATSAPDHRFEVDLPPDFPLIEADGDRIEQILTNIISNSVKYSPAGGRVRVSASIEGDRTVVSVADEGLGMTEAQLGLLFQRYQRIETDASKRIRGTGLGLYLTKGLVEAHGGRIWAESPGPGKGSTFSFVLPLRRVEERPGETAARTGES